MRRTGGSRASISRRQRSQTTFPSSSEEGFSHAGLPHTSHSGYSQVSRSRGSTFRIGWSTRLHPSTLHLTKDMLLPHDPEATRVRRLASPLGGGPILSRLLRFRSVPGRKQGKPGRREDGSPS